MVKWHDSGIYHLATDLFRQGITNELGVNEFAFICSFDPESRYDLTLGAKNDYILQTTRNFLPRRAGIFLTMGQAESEAIAILEDIDSSELSCLASTVYSPS